MAHLGGARARGQLGEHRLELIAGQAEIAGGLVADHVDEELPLELPADQVQQVVAASAADDDLVDVVLAGTAHQRRTSEDGADHIGGACRVLVLIDQIVPARRGNGQTARTIHHRHAARTGNVHDAFQAAVYTEHRFTACLPKCAPLFLPWGLTSARRYTRMAKTARRMRRKFYFLSVVPAHATNNTQRFLNRRPIP